MDVATIGQLIGSVGFPIVSFLIAAYFIKYTYDKSFDSISKLTEAVNNNTIVLTNLVEKLEDKED